MSYTNKELFNYFEILNSIASKVTGKLAYFVTKNARKISNELQEYNEIRRNKIQEYGYEEDGQIKLSYDSNEYKQFLADMAEYDDIELDISFVMAEPADIYTSTLNAIEIDQISFMIKDEDEEA